ncbi:PAS domain-containing protein [Pelagibius marinus]|uniref:PAS domain-containing protein n=1 Tax=Pelagibius marinus TaxID=2762760 RepID=UPI0018731410|nr:PAS domain-containing protein [Pelagibius marinus]
MTRPGDASRIPEPHLRDLYLYWHDKRNGRSWPAGDDIDTAELGPLLPYVMIVDVLQDGRFFRFRLIGDDVAIGVDPTGKLQHEELPEGIYRDHISALFRRGAAGPGALYSRSAYAYTEIEGPRSISRLFMPLAGDGLAIDMMLIGQTADRLFSRGPSAWKANPPTITEEVEFRLP